MRILNRNLSIGINIMPSALNISNLDDLWKNIVLSIRVKMLAYKGTAKITITMPCTRMVLK